MTLFFYGTSVDGALYIAEKGIVPSPIVMREYAWLKEQEKTEPDYFKEIVGDKKIEEVAQELAAKTGHEKYLNQVTLAGSMTLALLQVAKINDPKVILGFEINKPKAQTILIEDNFTLDSLKDIRLTEEAKPHARKLQEAYAEYQPQFLQINKDK